MITALGRIVATTAVSSPSASTRPRHDLAGTASSGCADRPEGRDPAQAGQQPHQRGRGGVQHQCAPAAVRERVVGQGHRDVHEQARDLRPPGPGGRRQSVREERTQRDHPERQDRPQQPHGPEEARPEGSDDAERGRRRCLGPEARAAPAAGPAAPELDRRQVEGHHLADGRHAARDQVSAARPRARRPRRPTRSPTRAARPRCSSSATLATAAGQPREAVLAPADLAAEELAHARAAPAHRLADLAVGDAPEALDLLAGDPQLRQAAQVPRPRVDHVTRAAAAACDERVDDLHDVEHDRLQQRPHEPDGAVAAHDQPEPVPGLEATALVVAAALARARRDGGPTRRGRRSHERPRGGPASTGSRRRGSR